MFFVLIKFSSSEQRKRLKQMDILKSKGNVSQIILFFVLKNDSVNHC